MASGRLLVEILSIGDELLIGQTVNTNAAWMGHLLENEGWRVNRCVVVSDEEEAIVEALKDAESRAELVLITGGLGPTRDDITKHVLCRHFGTELVRYPEIEDRIVAWFNRRGRPVLQVNRDQALLPQTCTPLDNPLGTASGMWFDLAPCKGGFTACTLHPRGEGPQGSKTLHPSFFTLHPLPFILHPSSFTLHHSPFIIKF